MPKIAPTEHQEQVALFQCFRAHEAKYPELAAAFAVPNGQKRDAIIGKKLKDEGCRAGIPDIFIPAPRGESHGLFVELKSQKGRLSDSQINMIQLLSGAGYACIWARGWEKAWVQIKEYLDSRNVVLTRECLCGK